MRKHHYWYYCFSPMHFGSLFEWKEGISLYVLVKKCCYCLRSFPFYLHLRPLTQEHHRCFQQWNFRLPFAPLSMMYCFTYFFIISLMLLSIFLRCCSQIFMNACSRVFKPILSSSNFIFEKTSRERPKSAPYLRLKIEKGGPFGLCETPVGCKK